MHNKKGIFLGLSQIGTIHPTLLGSYELQITLLGTELFRPLTLQVMAYLIKCSVCENEISINAEVCPYCGEPDPEPYREKFSFKEFFFGKDEE